MRVPGAVVSSGGVEQDGNRYFASVHVVVVLVALLSTSCFGGDSDDGSRSWASVQSGVDASVSWQLYRTELAVYASIPVEASCLAFETTPRIPQRQAFRPNGIPTTHKGKRPFCGLPSPTNSQAVVPEFKMFVVGGNIDSTVGGHDVFGLAAPEVTEVTGYFADGTTAEGHVQSGTFVLVWEGPKALEKLTALAGDERLSECRPPGPSDFLIIESQDKGLLSFGCAP